MTALKRSFQLRILETAAQDGSNHFVGVVHLKTGVEGALVHRAITQDTADGVPDTIGVRSGIINSR